jgi:hypothetical protein
MKTKETVKAILLIIRVGICLFFIAVPLYVLSLPLFLFGAKNPIGKSVDLLQSLTFDN